MKYRIALFGTFDVENYGDLMFPDLFKMVLDSRKLDYELFLFSPCETTVKALDSSTVVHSPKDLEILHNERPFNAIVIGGGAIIHYNKIRIIPQEKDTFYDYRIADTWIFPILFAKRNNIKVLFNAPQVPYEFPVFLDEITCSVFESCDYISVRDSVSSEYISDCFKRMGKQVPEITVLPDTVCCLPAYLSKNYLKEISQKFNLPEKYAVIQFNSQRNDNDEYVVKIVDFLKTKGIKTVLLPIGYTHNDQQVLRDFNNRNNNICEYIDKKLSIIEIASILSQCELYFGSSFHGAITAMIYDKIAVSYNYIFPATKNKDIFHTFNADDFVVSTAEEAYKLICDLYENKISFPVINDSATKQIEHHFDTITDSIKNESVSKRDSGIQTIDAIVAGISDCMSIYHSNMHQIDVNAQQSNIIAQQSNTITRQNDIVTQQNNTINDLSNRNNEQKEVIDNLSEEIKSQATVLDEKQKTINDLSSQLFEFKDSFFWKSTAVPRAIVQAIKNFIGKK